MNDHSYMINLKNKVLKKEMTGYEGRKLFICSGKPIEFNKRSIWLLSAEGEPPDYSLWLVEPSDGDDIHMWPYEGDNYDELIKELMEEFIATAFD